MATGTVSDSSLHESKMDSIESFLDGKREEVNRVLNQFLEYSGERIRNGQPISPDIDLAEDEIMEPRGSSLEAEMNYEAARFTLPTFYDETSPDEGPKRLRPSATLLAGLSLIEFDNVSRMCSVIPGNNLWSGILENPHRFDNPRKRYEEELAKAAASIEILHNFTLVHDDNNDEDLERRNVPTSWNRMREKAEERGWEGTEAVKMGMDQGMHIGNHLRNLSDEIIHMSGFTEEKKREMLHVLNGAESRILRGQINDLWMEGLNIEKAIKGEESGLNDLLLKEYEEEEQLYLDMIDKKTVELYVAAFDIGAVAADADYRQRDHLRRYARNIGVPFQIQDDLLELRHASSQDFELNKPLTDIPNGKATMPAITAYSNILDSIENMEGSDEESFGELEKLRYQKELFERFYGNKEAKEEDYGIVADIILEHESATDFYEERLEEAERHLEEVGMARQEDLFHGLADYLHNRDY